MYDQVLLNEIKEKQAPWLQGVRKEKYERFENLSIPSWKRLGFKGFSLPAYNHYENLNITNHQQEQGVLIKSIWDQELDVFKPYIDVKEQYGIGEKYTNFTEAFYNTGTFVYIPRNQKVVDPIRIQYELDQENPLILDHNLIVAEENAEVTIIVEYKGEKHPGFHNGITKVYAKSGAKVTVVKIQTLDDDSYHFDSNVGMVERDGEINWIVIELGSAINASNYTNYLEEEGSRADVRSIYLGDGKRKMDLGYSMIHRGRRSNSNIETRGVLKDHSKKIFRGNLDFKKGAARSKGVEQEYVILLDPTVKSDAIPALLCEEDDVEGEHAASAGQVNENQLFYLMSRGFDEKEAKKLIVEASFQPILDKLPIEDVKEKIQNEIHRRMIHES